MIVSFTDGEYVPIERLKMLGAIFDRITTGALIKIEGTTVSIKLTSDEPPPKYSGFATREMLR